MISEVVTLRSSDGLELEGVLEMVGSPAATLLLCHPHPQMGGTMNAPLLVALRDELVARRWAVLRFNFRGIGRSKGESGTGEAEISDVHAGLDLLRQRFSGLPLALGGWSFGAAVAMRVACAGERLVACVAVAPAVTPKPGVTAGMPPAESCDISCPTLLVTGANDDQISPAACRAWAEQVPLAQYVELPGANHFFWAKYETLAATVTHFLDETLQKEA
ncbi:MAG TPA: alpha/beta fold hydrolase [Actinomycetota bacterium]|jgi:alpha/beta superfamily hydrolase|nr:alpha/beta fold hydrolase [Actinomycetota bacterium]